MPANTTSVRLQILEAMLARFRGMTETDPTSRSHHAMTCSGS